MKQLRKTLSLLCVLAMALACLSVPAPAEETAFAGGSGTEEDPWQIETVEQLAYLASTVNDGSKSGYMGAYFALTADLDMTGVDWTPIGNMADMENYTALFQGTFDGQGHTVSNFTYENDHFIVGAGLFGISVGEITAVAPGALAGRAEGCTFESRTLNVTMNSERLPEIGTTDRMYESSDQ